MTSAVEDAGFVVRDSLMWLYGTGFPKSLDVGRAVEDSGLKTRRDWSGWGTALKPAHEPIVLARKPPDGTVARSVVDWGTGAINVDGCRIGHGSGGSGGSGGGSGGRWPSNVFLDDVAAASLDEHGAGVSKYFWVAKPSSSERVTVNGVSHPTVKPLALMRELVRLVTPPGGVVLDPFAGSGTTLEAAVMENRGCIGVEKDEHYLPLIRYRLNRRLDPAEAFRDAQEDEGLFGLFNLS